MPVASESLATLPSGHDPLFSDLKSRTQRRSRDSIIFEPDAAVDEPLPDAKDNNPNRTDHLGLPLRGMNRQRYKYARTYTIMYDAEKEKDIIIEKQYKLLLDAKKVLDMSIKGLRRLFRIFYHSVNNTEQSLVGQRHFRLALVKHGVRDVILMSRLFTEFCSPVDKLKIDYRQFIRILSSVSEEPVESKLGLLFEVWDVDQSGTLSYGELSPIILLGIPAGEMEALMDNFNRAWTEIRNNLSTEGNAEWIGLSRGSGVSNEDICDACVKLPRVRMFFNKILTRQPPKADDRTENGGRNFQLRLRELEAEMLKEMRLSESSSSLKLIVPEDAATDAGSPSKSPMRRSASTANTAEPGSPTSPPAQMRGSKSFKSLGKTQKELTLDYKARANAALAGRQSAATDSPSKGVKLPPVSPTKGGRVAVSF